MTNGDAVSDIVSEEICTLKMMVKYADYSYPNLVVTGDKFCILNTITNESSSTYDSFNKVKKFSFMGR